MHKPYGQILVPFSFQHRVKHRLHPIMRSIHSSIQTSTWTTLLLFAWMKTFGIPMIRDPSCWLVYRNGTIHSLTLRTTYPVLESSRMVKSLSHFEEKNVFCQRQAFRGSRIELYVWKFTICLYDRHSKLSMSANVPPIVCPQRNFVHNGIHQFITIGLLWRYRRCVNFILCLVWCS